MEKVANFLNENKTQNTLLFSANNGYSYGGLALIANMQYYIIIFFTYGLNYFIVSRKYEDNLTIQKVYFVEQ